MYSGRFQVFLTYFLVITEKFLTFFFEVISHFSLISRLFYWFSKFQAQLYFAVISHFSVTLLSYFSVTVWINFVVLALIVGEIVYQACYCDGWILVESRSKALTACQ